MKPAVAYIAGAFPTVSETFVYREVLALRSRGRRVQVIGLRAPGKTANGELADLRSGVIDLYGQGLYTAARLIGELGFHPLHSLATMSMALFDSFFPGEPLSVTGRLKLLAQAAMGVSVAGRLRQSRVDHVHCHFAHAPTSVGMYAAAQLGITFSFTGHANDLFQRRSLLKRKLERAAFVSCISEWHREFYGQLHSDDKGKYRVIRCGVPVDAWTPRNRIPQDDLVHVLAVGRLVEKKGIDTLIRGLVLWGQQSGRQGGWKLTIAGDGPERAALQALSRELGCEQHVAWLGSADNNRIRELMHDADIFALPCRADAKGDRDGIPVVVMEAMACGVPVIVGDLPAIRELVVDGQTGLLCEANDLGSVADCLARLANSRGQRQRLGAAGRRRVVEEFSLDQNIDRLEEALRACTSDVGEEYGQPAPA